MIAVAPTLLAVHAHPDDECLFTGGTIATCAARGVQVHLLVCSSGVEAGERPHTELVRRRRAELDASCVALGARDWRVLDWSASSSDRGAADCPHPTAMDGRQAEITFSIVDALERLRPDVVITYDERGVYGHPDHVAVSRATSAAITLVRRRGGRAPRLAHIVLPRSAVRDWWLFPLLEPEGHDRLPAPTLEQIVARFGVPDEIVWATVDVRAAAASKSAAIQAYRSQRQLHLRWLVAGPDTHEWYVLVDVDTMQPTRPGGGVTDDVVSGL